MDQFFDLSPDMLALANLIDGRWIRANSEFNRTLGWPEEELLTMRLSDLIHPDDLSPCQHFFGNIAAGAPPVSLNARMRCKNGETRWIKCNVAVYPDRGILYFVCWDLTRTKPAESALQESENRFRLFMDNSPAIAWIKDEQGRYVYVNQTLAEQFGIPADEWIGRVDEQIWPADVAAAFRRNDQAVLDAERTMEVTEESIHPDGTRHYWSIRKFPITDAAGKRYVAGIGIDITPLKNAEDALRAAGEKYRIIAENTADVIYKLRIENQMCIYASPSVEKMLGYTVEEVLSLSARDVLTPASYEHQLMKLLDAIATQKQEPEILELEMIHKEGHPVPVEINSSIIYDDRGQPVEILGVGRNITQRKLFESALQESRSRLRKLSDNLPHGLIYQIDSGTNGEKREFSYISAGVEQLHGITIGEAMNDASAIYGQVVDEDRALIADLEATASRSMTPLKAELRVRLPSGEMRWRLFTSAPRRLADGRTVWDGIEIDITDRKHAEQELERLNRTLEQQVAERTGLAETRTRQLQKLAVDLIEAEEKERYRIAGLLHDDLQQLMAAARMHVQVALDFPDAAILARVDQLLEESIEKSRRLSHELSPPVLHHAGLISAIEWLTRQMDLQFGLKVQLSAEGIKDHVNAPLKNFLFRAVQELLFNIVKHAGVKSARVAMSEFEGSLRVTISDQGRGFNPDRLSADDKKGLGLPSLQERALAMGGSLHIDSIPGQGSRFTLTVPMSLPEPTDPANADSAAGRQTANSRVRAGLANSGDEIRVLFADDHRVMRQGLIGLVTGQPNIRVVGEANDGEEALNLARKLVPDVVVMDISMPGMDGLEATRRIKAEVPGVRVIGLSMITDGEITRKMKELGAEAFVAKTASSSELMRAIYGISGQEGDKDT